MPSRLRIASLADGGEFRELERKLVSVDPLKFTDRKSYRKRLREARREAGVREAVTTGIARIEGHQAVFVVFDFGFLGGTMGSTAGEKIARAFEHAAKHRMPVVSVTSSGGARVQEGMLSLMQMAKVAAAATLHHQKGLPFISVLTDPTFGGVMASFASLGDVLIAEPGAQLGFVGPRVIEQTTGIPLPEGSHRAETLLRAGMIDLIVPRQELRETLGYLLGHLRPPENHKFLPVPRPPKKKALKSAAWEEVNLARNPERPTARQYIERMSTHFLEFHGDHQRGDDPTIVGGLAEIAGRTVLLIGQGQTRTGEPARTPQPGLTCPEGYRKSLRLMELAAKFHIPVVTLVDCSGARMSYESELGGICLALARNLAGMAWLPTPTVAVIIGEGGSGGALALAVADRVLMLQHAIYSVISPEGAAAILYREVEKVQVLAEELKLTARDLRGLGIIDAVVPEPDGGAHLNPAAAAEAVRDCIVAELDEIRRVPVRRLLKRRYKKYRHIGPVGVFWREVLRGSVLAGLDALGNLFPHAAVPQGDSSH